MPETAEKTNRHHSRSRSRVLQSGSRSQPNYLEPILYFTGALLVIIMVKLLHADLAAPAAGATAIILLAVSKSWKYTPGVLISMIFLLLMTMLHIWHWGEDYFVAAVSMEMTANSSLFIRGISEGAVLSLFAWIYARLFSSVQTRLRKRWFIGKSYVNFFTLLFYFHMFLLVFWCFAYPAHLLESTTRLSTSDVAMIAAALALIVSGIPAIIHFSNVLSRERLSHRHHHAHRHQNKTGSNSANVVEK
jgi:hypothetical protein